MAEFCPDCFLEFNPNLSKNDLVTIETLHLCEGCGKTVDKIVLYVKERKIYMTLEEKISQLETELAKVKAELAERRQSIWLPEDNQKFYHLTATGFPRETIFKNALNDDCLITNNNVFKCDKSTFDHLAWYNNNVLKVQNKLMQLHELLCPDYFPDWNDSGQRKFYVYYDAKDKSWNFNYVHFMNLSVVYFTESAAKRACEILNAEKFMMGDDA